MLNAWIGFDLLPSDRNRCTYTTTEIRSCRDTSEQKFMIEYFTQAEFENNTNKAETASSSTYLRDLRAQELEEINKYADEISSYLGQEPQIISFTNFDEVREDLKSAISSPGHTRAVKQIVIWTSGIGAQESLVLYDVPGYDSPITLHKEQTRAKIASVDAVLYAKTVTFFRSWGTHDQLV